MEVKNEVIAAFTFDVWEIRTESLECLWHLNRALYGGYRATCPRTRARASNPFSLLCFNSTKSQKSEFTVEREIRKCHIIFRR